MPLLQLSQPQEDSEAEPLEVDSVVVVVVGLESLQPEGDLVEVLPQVVVSVLRPLLLQPLPPNPLLTT